MATNEYGLDAHYMAENLERILRGIDRYRPEEMERALTRLAGVARPSSRSPALLPCPFCGNPARMKTGGGLFEASCTGFDCPGERTIISHDSPEKALAAWNTRAR